MEREFIVSIILQANVHQAISPSISMAKRTGPDGDIGKLAKLEWLP
jgi:hypothetical protein